MQRIPLSIADELAQALDRHMKKHRYASRSEALRDILRDARRASGWTRRRWTRRRAAAPLRSGQARDLGRRIIQAQHKHHDLQMATLHVHLDHDSCLEVSVLRGPASAVRALADETVSQRGVRHGQLHLVPAALDHGRHAHGAGKHGHEHIRV